MPDEDEDRAKPTSHTVPAVLKAVAIIRYLNTLGNDGVSLSDVASTLEMSRSHTHNILRTLVDCGWIAYDTQARSYRLTSLIAADTASGLVSEPYLGTFRAIVDRFAEIVGIPVAVAEPLPDGTYLQLLTIAHGDAFNPIAPPGYRFPRGMPPMFKAQYAWADTQTRAAAIAQLKPVAFTPRTILSKSDLLRDLELTRARGYGLASGEYIEGFSSLSLPVFDATGKVVIIISCAARSVDFEQIETDAGRALIACAHECHKAIDGRPPVDFPRP